MLTDDELLIYVMVGNREPLRLNSLQSIRLHRLLDGIEREKAGLAAGWRVNREAYRTNLKAG